MHEIRRILSAYDKIDFSTRKAALATVVNLYGSSYRRPGARMLVMDTGLWEGAISGGCLEGDALRKARKAMQTQEPVLVTYDTMNDDPGDFGVVLGCNGIIDVLIEPLDPENPSNPVELLRKSLNGLEMSVIATVFRCPEDGDVQLGDRLLVDYKGAQISTIKGENLARLVQKDIAQVQADGKSIAAGYDLLSGKAEVFIEAILPSIRLLIYGGGYDAAPLAKMASGLGWEVSVLDDCIAHLTPLRFPTADEVIEVAPGKLNGKVETNPYTAVVLMSHDYHKDYLMLNAFLPTDIAYIGILGPRKRGQKMIEQLEKEGKQLSESDLDCLHNPIGLDIGAETPEEIALSILSEIQAGFTGRKGGKLKEKEGYIHDRTHDIPLPSHDTLTKYTCEIRQVGKDRVESSE